VRAGRDAYLAGKGIEADGGVTPLPIGRRTFRHAA